MLNTISIALLFCYRILFFLSFFFLGYFLPHRFHFRFFPIPSAHEAHNHSYFASYVQYIYMTFMAAASNYVYILFAIVYVYEYQQATATGQTR